MELIVALITGIVLFGIGLYGTLSQTNLVMIMMGVELMLGAAMLNLVAFWRLPTRNVFHSNVCFGRNDSNGAGSSRWFCHCNTTFSFERIGGSRRSQRFKRKRIMLIRF